MNHDVTIFTFYSVFQRWSFFGTICAKIKSKKKRARTHTVSMVNHVDGIERYAFDREKEIVCDVVIKSREKKKRNERIGVAFHTFCLTSIDKNSTRRARGETDFTKIIVLYGKQMKKKKNMKKNKKIWKNLRGNAIMNRTI